MTGREAEGGTQRTENEHQAEHAAGNNPLARVLRPAATLLFYLAVLLGLVVLYGRGDFSTTGFIYQAF